MEERKAVTNTANTLYRATVTKKIHNTTWTPISIIIGGGKEGTGGGRGEEGSEEEEEEEEEGW